MSELSRTRPWRTWRGALFSATALLLSCMVWCAPAQAKGGDALGQARRCAQQLDSACVVRLLAGKEMRPAVAAEQWRLLAGALARLGEQPRAKAAFVEWLKLSKSHKLSQDSVPAQVWRAYQAAWLETRAASLDLRPKIERRASLRGAAQTALPKLPPPPRSTRDKARDTVLAVNLTTMMISESAALGGGLTVGLQLSPAFQLALLGYGAGGFDETLRLLAGLGLSARWHPLRRGDHRVGLLAEAGAGMVVRELSGTSAVLTAGLHYQWLPSASHIGLDLSLAERIYWADGVQQAAHCLRVGLLFRPGGKK